MYATCEDPAVNIIVGADTIQATAEHPFYVKGRWVEAEHLAVGDRLTLLGGGTDNVRATWSRDTALFVYNFTVEEKHTYYVSSSGVLVHNQCNTPTPRKVGNLQGWPLENATQTSGNFSLDAGPPDGVLYRANNQGEITIYIVYDSQGLALKRVDVTGAAHNGIPTPHVIEYGRNTLPNGNVRVQSKGIGDPRPATPSEIP